MPVIVLLIVLLVLQVLDYHTTKVILGLGGRELNPVMRWLMDRVGVEEALVLKGTLVVAVAVVFFHDSWFAVAVMDIIALAAVLYNQRSMPK